MPQTRQTSKRAHQEIAREQEEKLHQPSGMGKLDPEGQVNSGPEYFALQREAAARLTKVASEPETVWHAELAQTSSELLEACLVQLHGTLEQRRAASIIVGRASEDLCGLYQAKVGKADAWLIRLSIQNVTCSATCQNLEKARNWHVAMSELKQAAILGIQKGMLLGEAIRAGAALAYKTEPELVGVLQFNFFEQIRDVKLQFPTTPDVETLVWHCCRVHDLQSMKASSQTLLQEVSHADRYERQCRRNRMKMNNDLLGLVRGILHSREQVALASDTGVDLKEPQSPLLHAAEKKCNMAIRTPNAKEEPHVPSIPLPWFRKTCRSLRLSPAEAKEVLLKVQEDPAVESVIHETFVRHVAAMQFTSQSEHSQVDHAGHANASTITDVVDSPCATSASFCQFKPGGKAAKGTSNRQHELLKLLLNYEAIAVPGFLTICELFSVPRCSRDLQNLTEQAVNRQLADFSVARFSRRTARRRTSRQRTSFVEEAEARKVIACMSSTVLAPLFRCVDLSCASPTLLTDTALPDALCKMPSLERVIYPAKGWSLSHQVLAFLRALPARVAKESRRN